MRRHPAFENIEGSGNAIDGRDRWQLVVVEWNSPAYYRLLTVATGDRYPVSWNRLGAKPTQYRCHSLARQHVDQQFSYGGNHEFAVARNHEVEYTGHETALHQRDWRREMVYHPRFEAL